jgi:alcohol dehydrogenase class IV
VDREDEEALDDMSLAASLSGIAASSPAAVNIGHCIAETLGPLYDIPHGRAVAAALPYMVEFNLEFSRDRLKALARRLNMADESSIVPWLKATIKDVGLDSGFRQMGVPKEGLLIAAKMIFETRQYEYGLPQINPAPITLAGLESLLERTWRGE